MTFDSAAYVARYVTKKITGEKAKEINEFGLKHYENMDINTGEIYQLQPEYVTMSRGGRGDGLGGIGKQWFEKYKEEVINHDSIIINGKEVKPPKYYDGLYEIDAPVEYERNKNNRRKKANEKFDDNTFKRLAVKEVVKTAQFNMLKRGIE